jgi:hypothetical protein
VPQLTSRALRTPVAGGAASRFRNPLAYFVLRRFPPRHFTTATLLIPLQFSLSSKLRTAKWSVSPAGTPETTNRSLGDRQMRIYQVATVARRCDAASSTLW